MSRVKRARCRAGGTGQRDLERFRYDGRLAVGIYEPAVNELRHLNVYHIQIVVFGARLGRLNAHIDLLNRAGGQHELVDGHDRHFFRSARIAFNNARRLSASIIREENKEIE